MAPKLAKYGSYAVSAAMSAALLTGCSSRVPVRPKAPPPSKTGSSFPIPNTDLRHFIPALGRLGMNPCGLLSEDDLAEFGITDPPRQIALSQSPSQSCYWILHSKTNPSAGIQWVFIPYPTQEGLRHNASAPGARKVKVAYYTVTQNQEKNSCYQNLQLGNGDSFSTLVTRTAPNATSDICGLASFLTETTIIHLYDASQPSS